jgi:hypothetical protein
MRITIPLLFTLLIPLLLAGCASATEAASIKQNKNDETFEYNPI